MIVVMRKVRFANSPDGHANPRQRRNDQVDDGSIHENLHRAMPIAQFPEKQTEDTIIQAEDQPRDQAGSQQMPGHPQESKDGDQREQAKKQAGRYVAFRRETVEERDAIGQKQPGGEHQNQTESSVDANSNGRVGENLEPTVTR